MLKVGPLWVGLEKQIFSTTVEVNFSVNPKSRLISAQLSEESVIWTFYYRFRMVACWPMFHTYMYCKPMNKSFGVEVYSRALKSGEMLVWISDRAKI